MNENRRREYEVRFLYVLRYFVVSLVSLCVPLSVMTLMDQIVSLATSYILRYPWVNNI